LLLELDLVEELKEGRSSSTRSDLTSLDQRVLEVLVVARAASAVLVVVVVVTVVGLLGSALGGVANQLALRTRAESRLLALPVALGLLAHGGADGVRSNTRGTALSRSADSFTLGAVRLLAEILGAANIAMRLIAVNLALSTRSLFAMNLALGAFADRVALSRADGIIALPAAGGVAILLHLNLGIHLSGEDSGSEDQGQNGH